jgi:hypothetical protein
MAPKKQTPRKKQPAGDGPSKESFENELTQLAKQAKVDAQNNTWSALIIGQVGVYSKAAILVVLAAFYSQVSLLNLSPVYGSIPAGVWHHRAVVWPALFLGWGVNLYLRRALPFRTIMLLPLVAMYIPVAQFYLFTYSNSLAADRGAAITEALTLGPLLIISSACTADMLEGANLSRLPQFIADGLPGMASYAVFKLTEVLVGNDLPVRIGAALPQTRVGLELVSAASYGIMARSKLLLLGIPALLHAAFLNTHLMTPMANEALNATLQTQGWSLVDRWESLTGYVSVLDNHVDGYRVMRCDHSLLGGEWTKFGRNIVGEPIYSVFAQLEAVRLIEVPNKTPDNKAAALNM